MIGERMLKRWELESKNDDEYRVMLWGSKYRIQQLIKEVKRLNKKCSQIRENQNDAIHVQEVKE